jgi:hypothetical protein
MRRRNKPMSPKDGQHPPERRRPLGIRLSLARSFLVALETDFEENATDVIQAIRKERPLDYLKIVLGLFPNDALVDEPNLEEMSDDELARFLWSLESRLDQPSDPAGTRATAPQSVASGA